MFAANPSWLTLSGDQTRLFVVNENGKGQADVVGRASSVAIDPKTNELPPSARWPGCIPTGWGVEPQS